MFEIRSGIVDALLLSPRATGTDALATELARRFVDTPEFFSNDVIAVDMRRLAADERLPIDHLVETLTVLCARTIGVIASPEQAEQAQTFGLPPSDSYGRRPRGGNDAEDADRNDIQDTPGALKHAQAVEIPVSTPAVPAADAVVMQPGTMIVDRPLRSGQRVYARGDLVMLDLVNDSAEMVVEGSIYMYASLHGCALAGMKGNLDVCIFCICLELQLASITRIYRTSETPWPDTYASKPVQVRLTGNTLVFEPLRMK